MNRVGKFGITTKSCHTTCIVLSFGSIPSLRYALRPRFVLGAPIYHAVEKTYRIYIPQKGCQISFVCKTE